MSTATATALETVTPLVKEWCAAHADRIQACYLADDPRDGLVMVLVQRQDMYDDILSDAYGDFLQTAWRTHGAMILPWQAGGPEEEVWQVYPVKLPDRVFGG